MQFIAEIFDRFQKLFDITGFNDHQLHCVMKFNSAPNAELLKKAVITSINTIPILGTRYISKALNPHWESLGSDLYINAFSVVRTPEESTDSSCFA